MGWGSFDEFQEKKDGLKFHQQKNGEILLPPPKWFHMNESGISVIIAPCSR